MSVIGPRPQLVRDMTFMTKEQRMRHTAKPGLSGLAQVNGRNAITWEDKLEWDQKYIKKVGFKEDVRIILETVKKAFIKQEGISQDNMATAEDFGDYLLKNKKITSEEYDKKQIEATISLIEPGTLVIGVLTQSDLYEKTISNMLECKSRGAYLMGLTTYGKYEIEDQVNFAVYVPKIDEHFVGSLAVVPLQLMGYYVSVAKGLDVDKGNVITGDHILYIYGKYMKERGKLLTNTVVTTVMSNFGLYKAFDELGIDYAKTAVGDKYVYEYMMKNGCRIGGEQSGHIIFSKYASTGDGILTSLKIMEVMMARKKKLSELSEGFTVYPQVLTNVRVTDKKAAQDDADVQAAVKKVTEELGDTGRILVRESGTEPVVRVMVEAESEEICQKYVDMVVNVIKENGYVAG